MIHDLVLVAISVAVTAGVGAIIAAVVRASGLGRRVAEIEARQGKRSDRLEAGIVVLLEVVALLFDVQVVSLSCQQKQSCNGELDDAKEKLEKAREIQRKYLASAAISRKPAEGKS